MPDELQGFIAFRVAESVVIGFEMIDVDHHKAHRVAVTVRSADLLCQALLEIAPVQKAGQRVGHRKLFEFAGFVFQHSAVDGQRQMRGDGIKQFEVRFFKGAAVRLIGKIKDHDLSPADGQRVAHE